MKRINITCPACGSRAYLRPASVVYGDKAPDPDAKYYVCGRYPACDCYVAAHRKTMLPMGTLADKALRKKRHDAHVALDSLWKNGVMSRKEAYRLLQLSMGLPAEEAHIAKFSAARCDEVIALSRRFRAAAARAAYCGLQVNTKYTKEAGSLCRGRGFLLVNFLTALSDIQPCFSPWVQTPKPLTSISSSTGIVRYLFAPIDHTSLQQITLLGRNKDSRVGRFYLKTATVDQIQRV